MPDNPLTRRLITIPVVVTSFLATTALAPALIFVAASVDLTRSLSSRKPWITIRSLTFVWVYLLGELWALLALLVTAVLPTRQRQQATLRLQRVWAAWNMKALQLIFSVGIVAEGMEVVVPGPIVVLSRHASIVDTLLPAHLIARPFGLRIRYVLKKELLADPALDIAGNRLPNAFIDRGSRDVSERESITTLAGDLGLDEAVLIYPEGTRFTETKLRRHRRRLTGEGTESATALAGLRKVLPPRPGGTLALLEATSADIVVLAHRGLEGLATVRDIWGGGLVGSQIEVSLWRIPRAELPTSRADRVEWLYRVWAEIDEWVVSGDSPAGGSFPA